MDTRAAALPPLFGAFLFSVASAAGPQPPAPSPADRPFHLLVDAGHGAPENSGNTSSQCESEAAVMLALADDLVARLRQLSAADPAHPVEVRTTREGTERPDYGTRIVLADSWPADLLLSLHSDARAGHDPATSAAGCVQTQGAAGFAVLYGEDLPGNARDGLLDDRRAWAGRLAASLAAAGFSPYGGADYGGLYRGTPEVPGLFVDTHAPSKRIRMLRRPLVPSVIVETHNALDPEEPLIWRKEAVKAGFASAVLEAVRAGQFR